MRTDGLLKKQAPDLQLSFDVGHSSIGWAVLQTRIDHAPQLLGCGAVIFPADDCLASKRRQFRRQRRHIRSTRQRIARMKTLLLHLGVMTQEQLDAVTTSSPWLFAARVLDGGKILAWPELWDVLRWYAHNRGYDGNRRWSADDAAAQEEDTEKEANAIALMQKHGTTTMAETFCKELGLAPDKPKRSSMKRFKGLNAAFPRETVVAEVARLLRAHQGQLRDVDKPLTDALINDWETLPFAGMKLPARYDGGLLFGQLVPRFDNRIIATCPITFERVYQRMLVSGDEEKAKHEAEKLAKVPAADCREFFRYRWAMQLANVVVQTGKDQTQRLSAEQRRELDAHMAERGALSKGEFARAVELLTGGAPTNIKQMLLHPDADKALVVDRAQRELTGKEIAPYFATLPERLQRRIRGQLRRGKAWTLREMSEAMDDPAAFEAVLAREIEAAETRREKKTKALTREGILARRVQIEPISGRAPHSRELMREVAEFIFSTDRHPADKDGPLYRSETIRAAQLARAIDEQTNNHLVRHRLRILERLHADLLKTYASDDPERVAKVTIEVNRDLKELSGKTAKLIAQDLGLRLSNFKSVTTKLEKAFEGKNISITPGLIRKARIAEDLDWKCPYTGASYDAFDLASRRVDKDHIVPRSQRASDSLDSLVITFAEVNKMKGKRTAACFIEECQGCPVEGAPNLSIKTLTNYLADVEKLEAFKGHDDDKRRKRNRKRLLVLRDYVEKEFTPRDLTQTSQLVRLGAQTLEKRYATAEKKPVITSLPGSVTGSVRRSWDLLGCLQAANPLVLDPATGEVRTKTEIRDITHLHHAVDACILGFASLFLPRDGGAWELLVKRRLNPGEQSRARKLFGSIIDLTQNGELRLRDLPATLKDQVRARLAERRVMQHLPREMAGLRAELNAWRVAAIDGGDVTLRQRIRQPDGSRPLKEKKEKRAKLVGLQPGKLHRLKAALVIADNYGLALDPEPTIIPHHHVWKRLGELKARNAGKPVRVLRNGMLIRVPQGKFAGVWRIFSVKNNTSGIAVDMGRPDVCRLQSKTEGHKINVLLTSLLRGGLEIVPDSFAGVPSVSEPKNGPVRQPGGAALGSPNKA
jgi:hypothetical protein